MNFRYFKKQGVLFEPLWHLLLFALRKASFTTCFLEYRKFMCAQYIKSSALISLIVFVVSGCSSYLSNNNEKAKKTKMVARRTNNYTKKQDGHPDPSNIPNLASIREPQPKYEPKSRYGNLPSYTVFNKTYSVLNSSDGYKERGHASWYGTKFHGFKTSNGEIYDMYSMTAAHKTLPLPTYAKVTNLHNKRSVIVRINDRGPFHGNRIIDLSYAAASRLGIIGNGVGMVEITAINPGVNAQPSLNYDPVNKEKVHNFGVTSKSIPKPNASLQLGAFVQKSNAQKLVDQLEALLKNYQQNCKVNIVLQKNNLKKTDKENTLYKVVVSSVHGELNIQNLKNFLSSIPNQDAFTIN